MADMLVNLLALPDYAALREGLLAQGVEVFRAIGPDRLRLVRWVEENTGISAAGECDCCFSNHPVSCFVAVNGGEILGYACYDATAPDFFGPTMVAQAYRGRGIGRLLLMESLADMRQKGYVYAIIGGVGPAEFYEKAVGARMIEGSTPGIYKSFIGARRKKQP